MNWKAIETNDRIELRHFTIVAQMSQDRTFRTSATMKIATFEGLGFIESPQSSRADYLPVLVQKGAHGGGGRNGMCTRRT